MMKRASPSVKGRFLQSSCIPVAAPPSRPPPLLVLLLTLSVVGLLLGPALVALGRARAVLSWTVDGFTLGMLPLLVLLRLLPHTVASVGLGAIGLAIAGFTVVTLAHRGGHAVEARVGRTLVLPTLFVHALADGAALAVSASSRTGTGGWLLGAAVVLHRLPEGLFVASTTAPADGVRGMVRRTSLLAAATVIGALGGARLLDVIPDAVFDGLVAFGLGAMLRVATHTHQHASPSRRARAASGLAFFAGIALVLLVPGPDDVLKRAQPRELSVASSLLPLFVETAPSILLGLLAAGALHVWMRPWMTAWLRGGSSFRQALRGMAFGMPLPLCSCGVLPMARRLLSLGVPAAAVASFAVATPELGVDSALLSLRLLGLPLTIARALGSVVIALGVALVVARLAAPPSDAASMASFGDPEPALEERPRGLRAILSDGFGATLDHNGAWIAFGLLLAAALEAALDPTWVARLGAPFDVAAAAVVAVPVYVCAQGATPLAAVLVHKGASVGAALAFLWVGPSTNLPILAVLRRELGTRAAVGFAVTSLLLAVGAGFAANRFVAPGSLPAVHPLVAHAHHPVEWVAAVALAALLVASVLRVGPRAWLSAMALEGHVHDHDDPHAEEHEHVAGEMLPAAPDDDHHPPHDHHHDHGHGHHHH